MLLLVLPALVHVALAAHDQLTHSSTSNQWISLAYTINVPSKADVSPPHGLNDDGKYRYWYAQPFASTRSSLTVHRRNFLAGWYIGDTGLLGAALIPTAADDVTEPSQYVNNDIADKDKVWEIAVRPPSQAGEFGRY